MNTLLHPRHRHRQPQGRCAHYAPVGTAAVSIVGGQMRLSFDTPVSLQGPPLRVTVNGVAITGATQVSPQVIDLACAAPPAAGQPWSIPANLVEIRTRFGGTVAAATGTF